MFKQICSRTEYPSWVAGDERYRTLDTFDRLLDGTFYDCLPHAFYDEKNHRGDPIPLKDRRPSSQYHLPRMVSRWCARKLFAGRHVPRLFHPDAAALKRINRVAKRARLFDTLLEAATLGSVGSVAVTFRVDNSVEGFANIALTVWRSKFCTPSFNDNGDLDSLRIAYGTSGAQVLSMGYASDAMGQAVSVNEKYWFIRDYTRMQEITYVPVRGDQWNPVKGPTVEGLRLWAQEDDIINHMLGFVPGHWFKNLSGGKFPDGACTWEDAIPNSIEIDYTMSQVGRGVRYNCAPQPVIKGRILNDNGGLTRSPTHYIHLEGDKKDADGNVVGGATAMLLEMNGSGIKAAMEVIDKLHKMALEQISAARKDPEKMKGPLSGRAMEFLDEDSHDLAMELRTSYGEHGLLPLLKKIIKVTDPDIDTEKLGLRWPRMYQPTPQDIAFLIPALAQAIDPLGVSGKPKPMSAVGEGQVAPVPEMQVPDVKNMIITPEEARAYMRLQMDLDMLDTEENDDEDMPDKASANQKKDHPDPLGVGEIVDRPAPGEFGMTIHAPVRVNS